MRGKIGKVFENVVIGVWMVMILLFRLNEKLVV